MQGRCESDCGGDEVYLATFGNEEKTGLKLETMMMMIGLFPKYNFYQSQCQKLS